MSKKDTIVAEVMARGVAWFTTHEPQQVPLPLVDLVKKSPVGKAIKNHYKAEAFEVRSFDGTRIAGTVWHNPKGCEWNGKKHVVLLQHGFEVQQMVMLFNLPFFTTNGYDCVTIDLRRSGISDMDKFCTMGYNEAKDVASAAKWVREQYGEDVVFGLYGQSMGSATIMQYSPEDPNLAFMIEDCGYANLKNTIHEIQSRVLKFVNFEEFYPRVLKYAEVDGVTYDDVSAIDAIRRLDPEVPTMYLHSTGDTYIAPKNVEVLFEARPGTKKEMHTYSIAPHSASFFFHPIQYKKDIDAFLKKFDLAR